MKHGQLAGVRILAQRMGTQADAAAFQRGKKIYSRLCVNCHGVGARGDGPIGRELKRPAMDLLKKNFWLISWGPGAESEKQALARLVKYGVPGTSMAGHETLSSQEIADIVAYVQQIRQAGRQRLAQRVE